MKRILLLTFSICLSCNLFAQKHYATDRDTLLYYMNSSDHLVKTKAEASYFLLIMPADSSSTIKVYPVIEYYPTMKKKLLSYSRSQQYNALIFEGQYADFYPNGARKSVKSYSNGRLTGNLILYFPGGKLYADEAYDKDGNLLLINCQDTAGFATATDGKGEWTKYDDDFNKIIARGAVKDSVEEGAWFEDFLGKSETTVYKKGAVVSSTSPYRQTGKQSDIIFAAVQQEPLFKGDFGAYLVKTIHYPDDAKTNNKQGKVFLQFVVARDGSLSDIKIMRSSGNADLDNEAVRVMSISPKWEPGMQNNKPVRVMYTVPISFTLSSD